MTQQKGSTIVELIIYMGLLGILMVIMTNLFVSILDVRLSSESNSAIQQDGRFITSRLTYDIRRAKQIISPVFATSSATMQLVVNDGGADYTITYDVSGTQLNLSNGINQNRLNGYQTQVSGLEFVRIGNSDLMSNAKDSIRVTFRLTSTIVRNSGVEIKDFQTTISQR